MFFDHSILSLGHDFILDFRMLIDIAELHRTSIPMQGACSGIYFLFADEDLVYVGEGWNCALRVAEHTRKESTKVFTHWNFIPIENAEARKAAELEMRRKYKPKYNKV